MTSKTYTPATIIHLFAAAHALVAVASRLMGYYDEVMLTLLTIALLVILSIRRHLQAETVAALTLIGCFAGFFIGNYGAHLIGMVLRNDLLTPAITTALVTEILGWSVYAFTLLKDAPEERRLRWSPSLWQILTFAATVLLLRIAYMMLFRTSYFVREGIYFEFRQLLGNIPAMMVLLCGNIILMRMIHRLVAPGIRRNAATISMALVFTLLITTLVYYLPQEGYPALQPIKFLRLYAIVLLTDIVVYSALKLITSAIDTRNLLRSERDKKHQAQFQYDKLKLQINPHFLFNSLNILDFLVQEGEKERASSFIHKLAETYRYMLKNENKQLVQLQEELEFARKYIDLLQERFADGFTVQCEIPPKALSLHVIPCCLQLLIENATKHNVVNPLHPLTITIRTEGDLLVITNNLQPRLSAQASTGTGLKNIRQQYLDISKRLISVEKTSKEFIVKLPLL